MDFYNIKMKAVRVPGEDGKTKWITEVGPDFIVTASRDLMVRGGAFYAIWNEKDQMWSTNEYDVVDLVDADLIRFKEEKNLNGDTAIKDLRSYDSNSWTKFKRYLRDVANSYHELDSNIIFANTEVKKEHYASKRLNYSLEPGDHSAWDQLLDVLYAPEERAKIEWAIGAIVSGDSKEIQKFLVFYGPPRSGKSTILNIIHQMFYQYTAVFEAKALGNANATFATEAFKENPLVAIQHDGDLSRIEDNTRLNSIIAHEDMLMHEKYKPAYMARVNAFLLMGTNQPVKISDARSGLIRRLVDVTPTGDTVSAKVYHELMSRIKFEHGAIAHHCLQIYKRMGKHYYDSYRPTEMMYRTDTFFNFVEAHYDIFANGEGVSLKQAWNLYKAYVQEASLPYSLSMNKFREELKDYFKGFEHRARIDGQMVTSWFHDFDRSKFHAFQTKVEEAETIDIPRKELMLNCTDSLFDGGYSYQPAQYANKAKTPKQKWDDIETTLGDLDTRKLHFVKVPENHIVIDFDLKDEDGNKSAERNLAAASEFPSTYAEFSQGGGGVHLHYNYSGDPNLLRRDYSDGIEVKVFTGNSSLRRKLSKCNNEPIATLNGGLPLKEKKVLNEKTIKSERGLRELIEKNLRKEIHPGTKPSVDFIYKILDDAYQSGLVYDVTDMRGRIVTFAANSTNQSDAAFKVVQKMKWKSEEDAPGVVDEAKDERIAFYDVEVYPNLFVVCWKFDGGDMVKMINPSAREIEALFKLKLVGFNNRRYDNHILMAASMGYDNDRLYKLSQKIIDGERNAMFGLAYGLSYADIYDFSSKKQSLKKFMIELGLPHVEMGLPWDKPVPEDKIDEVVEYCCNDVNGTEATFHARKADFTAREILAELSGLTVNDTTQKHTAKIIFNGDKNPQAQFVYTDLSEEFPGYEFNKGKSTYRAEEVGEGGYVYAEPGMYERVAVLDVASMHPTSIEQLNLFGDYTKNFSDLKAARIAIKHKDWETAEKALDGKLKPFLESKETADDLAYALKIVINIVYGLTSAKFDNPFRDNRNIDNIVAKRGALFMIDLKHACQEKGLQVVHIKTDSIKIPDATQEDIDEIIAFGSKYGYDFEHEATYDKFCLVNDAVYIAKKGDDWDAVGAQFQHPFVYKTLFSGEKIVDDDLCETKQVVQGAMYLDFEYDRPAPLVEGMKFVGKIGRFTPVVDNGAILYRVKDDKYYAVTGTKGFTWVESSWMKELGAEVDMSYYHKLVDEAQDTIKKFGDLDWFLE